MTTWDDISRVDDPLASAPLVRWARDVTLRWRRTRRWARLVRNVEIDWTTFARTRGGFPFTGYFPFRTDDDDELGLDLGRFEVYQWEPWTPWSPPFPWQSIVALYPRLESPRGPVAIAYYPRNEPA